MAAPAPASLSPSSDPPVDLQTILRQLQARPDHSRFCQLYDLTSPVVWTWALATTPNRVWAEAATLDTYARLWRRSRRYPVALTHPWSWLQAAVVESVQQLHHASRLPASVPDPAEGTGAGWSNPT